MSIRRNIRFRIVWQVVASLALAMGATALPVTAKSAAAMVQVVTVPATYSEGAVRAVSSTGRFAVVDQTDGIRTAWLIDRLHGTNVQVDNLVAVDAAGAHGLKWTSRDGYSWVEFGAARTMPVPISPADLGAPDALSARLFTVDGRLTVVPNASPASLFDANTGNLVPVGPEGSAARQISSDGRYVLVTESCPGQCLSSVIVDRATGARAQVGVVVSNAVVNGGRYATAMSSDGRYLLLADGPYGGNAPQRTMIWYDRVTGRQVVVGQPATVGTSTQLSDDGQTVIETLSDGTLLEATAPSFIARAIGTARHPNNDQGRVQVPALSGDGSSLVDFEIVRVSPAPGPQVLEGRVTALPLSRTRPHIAAGETVEYTPVVPAGVESVVLNVTVTNPAAPGYVTVWPCGLHRPVASNVNYVAGQTVPNTVVVRPGAGGRVCLFTQSAVDLVVDVQGYVPGGTPLTGVAPYRLLDSRFGVGRSGTTKVPAGEIVHVRTRGVGGVPEAATAVVVNLTATEPGSAGFVTAYPCGGAPPVASNLNFEPQQTVANAAVLALDSTGDICLVSNATTHLVVDLDAYSTGADAVIGLTPTRLVDSRRALGTASAALLPARTSLVVPVAGSLPAGATGVVLNVTATAAASAGYLTVYPCDELPETSNGNFVGGGTSATLAISSIGLDGTVCVFVSQPTHLVVDVTAGVVGGQSYVGVRHRGLDSRS